MNVALRVQDLSFDYPDGTPGLRGVSFEVARGEAVALLGANGSGKSTLLLNLVGVLRGRGRIEVLGIPVEPARLRDVRRKLGVLMQDVDAQLFSPRVLDDVAFGPLNVGKTEEEAAAKARACLAQVGLASHEARVPHHLSFGEKKRVAIAAALALDPDVLLLDEPTAGLDPRSATELLDLLIGLKEQGRTIVTTTHDLHLAAELCDRVLVVSKGTIATSGTPDVVLGDQHLLEEHNLVHRHRHRHKHQHPAAHGKALPLVEPHVHEHGHAHDHLDHGHGADGHAHS